MKKIKKFLLTMAMTMIFSVSAFAASGFEFILNVPLGVGIGIPSALYKEMGYDKSGVGFDGGVAAQLGYMFQVKEGFGISVLGELGYAHSTYALSSKQEGHSASMFYGFESFQIGLLPKFNIGAFAIGIGGGVKIPVAAQMSYKYKVDGGQEEKGKEKIAVADFLKNSVIGYFKATFDYSIFFRDNLAFNVGLYLGLDFLESKQVAEGLSGETLGIIDIGVELGLKFGPKA